MICFLIFDEAISFLKNLGSVAIPVRWPAKYWSRGAVNLENKILVKRSEA